MKPVDIKIKLTAIKTGGTVHYENGYVSIIWNAEETAKGNHLQTLAKAQSLGFVVVNKTRKGRAKYTKGIEYGEIRVYHEKFAQSEKEAIDHD